MLHSPKKQLFSFPPLILCFAGTYSDIIYITIIVKQEFITWLGKLIFVKVNKHIEVK